MVSSDEIVLQISRKASHLFSKNVDDIVGYSFKKLMPQIYSNHHSKWVEEWISKFGLKSEEEKPKIILIEELIIKVTMMNNIMIPRFSEGILILSKFSQPQRKSVN